MTSSTQLFSLLDMYFLNSLTSAKVVLFFVKSLKYPEATKRTRNWLWNSLNLLLMPLYDLYYIHKIISE